MKLLKSLIFISVLTSSSCSSSSSNFVGKWDQIDGNHTVEFIKQGDSLLFSDGQIKSNTVDNKDGMVSVEMPYLGVVVFVYSEETETISALGDTFQRVE